MTFGSLLPLTGVVEAVRGGAGFDDGAVKREPVDDCRTQARVSEGLRPPAKRLVGCDRDGVLLFPLCEDLEQEFGAASVEFEATEVRNFRPRRVEVNSPDCVPYRDGLRDNGQARHQVVGCPCCAPAVAVTTSSA